MKKSHSRYLEEIAQNGEFVAAWMNSADGWGASPEAQKRTISLVERLGELRANAIKKLPVDEAEITAVNDSLQKYPWVLRVFVSPDQGKLGFLKFPAPGTEAEGQTWLRMVVQLMEAGLLDRLRRCAHCGIWFYANRPKGKFHSTACRQVYFRSTAEYREQNREYQRKYYKDWRSAATGKQAKERKGKRNAKKR